MKLNLFQFQKRYLKKNERIEKLINTDSNIEGVYSSISNQIKKDKFESTKEYQSRLKKPKFNTYAVMEEDGQKKYDADKKLYKVCFSGPRSYQAYTMYKRGDTAQGYDFLEPKKNIASISFRTSSKTSTAPMSNSFGAVANVTKSESTSFAIHPDNFKSIMKKKNIVTEKDKDPYSSSKATCVNIPANKEIAKKMEKYSYVIKMGVTFINIQTKLYQNVVGSDATISSPSSYSFRTWGFDGHINEFAIYNKDTKEILFSYTD